MHQCALSNFTCTFAGHRANHGKYSRSKKLHLPMYARNFTSSLIWISSTLTELLTRSLCLTWESQISPAPISILSDAIVVRFGTLRLCRHPNLRLELVLYICICTASSGYIPFSTLVLRAHGPDDLRFVYCNSRRLVSVRNEVGYLRH
jgi:hypothetical protein